jgi:sugar lactone lactonase YvrE
VTVITARGLRFGGHGVSPSLERLGVRVAVCLDGLLAVLSLAPVALAAPGIATVAGDGTAGYAGDGSSATTAELDSPAAVAVDSRGDLLIADQISSRVRMVAGDSCSSGCPYGLTKMTKRDIYTVAGNGTRGRSGDGRPARNAELSFPSAVALDARGDLLIADYGNHVVRLVAGASCASGCPYGLTKMTKGDIYTVAGGGTAGFSGDRGPATRAELTSATGVGVDPRGDLLIALPESNRVRLVAGGSCPSDCPYGVTKMTKGDIYTVAGDGRPGYSGDRDPATGAELIYATGVGVDTRGDLLIADSSNNRVRLVAADSCPTGCPYGLTKTTKGDIYTVAGDGTSGYAGDGAAATGAELDSPETMAVDSRGDLLIADSGNEVVRLVAAGSCPSGCPYGLASMTKGDIYTVAGNGAYGYVGDHGPATSAELWAPSGVAVDARGDLLIADTNNNRVRLVGVGPTQAGDMIFWGNFDGNSIGYARLDGSGGGGLIDRPINPDEADGLAIDSATGRIYWANFGGDTIGFGNLAGTSAGFLSAPGATFAGPAGVAIDPATGRIYWANYGSGTIDFASLNGSGGGRLKTPGAVIDQPNNVAVDPANGRIYWANAGNNTIYSASLNNTGDGQKLNTGAASVAFPNGIAIDVSTGKLYWANSTDNTHPIAWAETNDSGAAGNLKTIGATAQSPMGLALDPAAGKIYWANNNSGTISFADLNGAGAGGQLATAGTDPFSPGFPVLLKTPQATAPPKLTGATTISARLSCSQGTWAPDLIGAYLYQQPGKFIYAWNRNGIGVPGATNSSITATHVGSYTCTVTAENAAGTTTETSAPHKVT